MSMRFTLAVPERPLVDNLPAEWVIAPAINGYVQILPKHAEYKALLGTGLVRMKGGDGAERLFVVEGGFLEVKDGDVAVLADAATPAGAVSREKVEAMRKESEAALKAAATPETVEQALQQVHRAAAMDEALSRR